ncbi:MAG: hypothetical protein AW07_03803 [Candidatus Accumulibacter sp. SK-11]|nr:MAG: hypothetical protein AW07_03803 [Candidatus Accumulibacter sp. SK-11]
MNGNCADLTSAATTKPAASRRTVTLLMLPSPASHAHSSVPADHTARPMPSINPASPTRLVMKAKSALRVASGRSQA